MVHPFSLPSSHWSVLPDSTVANCQPPTASCLPVLKVYPKFLAHFLFTSHFQTKPPFSSPSLTSPNRLLSSLLSSLFNLVCLVLPNLSSAMTLTRHDRNQQHPAVVSSLFSQKRPSVMMELRKFFHSIDLWVARSRFGSYFHLGGSDNVCHATLSSKLNLV